jgi:serine/threonine protein kinase
VPGIVHRDLKPGDVMLTKAGAKLLDVGTDRKQRAWCYFDLARTVAFSRAPSEQVGESYESAIDLHPEETIF